MTHNTRPRVDCRQNTLRGYCLLVCSLFPFIVYAGDPVIGKQKIVACVPCHGTNGISAHPTWPNLVGQDAQYLTAQLKAFRDGARKSAMMYPMAFDLTDKDIDNIAAYYNQLNCK